MSEQLSRRQFGALALTGIGTTLLLEGCGTSATPQAGSTSTAAAGDAFKKATLNFAWWSNPVRTTNTGKMVQAYTTAHSAITVNQQPGQWATYWTKLSAQVAGQTEPDVIQMDQAYIAEYGGRGALLDMSTVRSIDTKQVKSSLADGTLNGKLYGIPVGETAYSICANKNAVDYLEKIKSEIKRVPPVPSKGTSTVASVSQRHTEDVIFGRATPAAAAAAFRTEVQSLLASNS